jgi:hypothetical protein
MVTNKATFFNHINYKTMKNTFNLEVINTGRMLTSEEQQKFRLRLNELLKLEGLISMCLDADSLYVEFNPQLFSLGSFKSVLSDIGFPLKHELKLATYHYAV